MSDLDPLENPSDLHSIPRLAASGDVALSVQIGVLILEGRSVATTSCEVYSDNYFSSSAGTFGVDHDLQILGATTADRQAGVAIA